MSESEQQPVPMPTAIPAKEVPQTVMLPLRAIDLYLVMETAAKPQSVLDQLYLPLEPARNLVNADAIQRDLAKQQLRRIERAAAEAPLADVSAVAAWVRFRYGDSGMTLSRLLSSVDEIVRQVFAVNATVPVTIYHRRRPQAWAILMADAFARHKSLPPAHAVLHADMLLRLREAVQWRDQVRSVDLDSVLAPRAETREELQWDWWKLLLRGERIAPITPRSPLEQELHDSLDLAGLLGFFDG